jgi:hypothetical protein
MSQVFTNLATDPTVGAVGLALALAAGGLWLAAAWWTYTDMARRTTLELVRLSAAGWILISTPLLLPLALATYVLFEAMAPALDDGACPGCGTTADASWHRCPRCATWLAASCDACGAWSAADLDLCPYCARDKTGTMDLDPAAPPVTEPVTVPVLQRVPVGGSRVVGSALRQVALTSGGSGGVSPMNRGARDPGRTQGADRTAGSPRLGVGS